MCSKALFGKCIELAPAFNILLKRPTQLHLYPEETYGTDRLVANVQAPAFAVADMPQMAHYVHQRACLLVQAMHQQVPVTALPQEYVSSEPQSELVVATSDANEVDAPSKRDEAEETVVPAASELVKESSAGAPVETAATTVAEVPVATEAAAEAVTAPVEEHVATEAPATPSKKTPKRKRTAQDEEAVEAEATPKPSATEPSGTPSATPAASTPGKNPNSMTVAELRAALGELGVDTKGLLKKDLVVKYTEATQKQ